MKISHETVTDKMEQIAQRIAQHSCAPMDGRIPLPVAKRLVRAEVKALIARKPLETVNTYLIVEMLDFTFNENFFRELTKISEQFVAKLN